MRKQDCINIEINQLKELLEITAKENEYNFRHPKVLDISQKLDSLIILKMKQKLH